MVPIGVADIFFPTNFDVLRLMYNAAAKKSNASEENLQASTYSTKEFMSKYADVQKTKTRSGFNPLLSDYANTKIFTGRRL
jgi:hypothetical protein